MIEWMLEGLKVSKPVYLQIDWPDGCDKEAVRNRILKAGGSLLLDAPFGGHDWARCENRLTEEAVRNVLSDHECVVWRGDYTEKELFADSENPNLDAALLGCSIERVV